MEGYIHSYIHTYIHTHIHTHIHTYIHTYIHTDRQTDRHLAKFLKTYFKTGQIFAQEPGDSQVSGHCGEKKHRGLAVLVGLIVKLSPGANSSWVGKGPPC